MAVYRSALGKPVDMSALATKNEKTRAVGNMKVNARGDTIDGMGKVIVPVTEKVNQKYSKTVGNKSANVVPPSVRKPIRPTIKEDLTPHEKEIEESFEDDLEIEQIKQKEMGKK